MNSRQQLLLPLATLVLLPARAEAHDLFLSSDNCMACHNGLLSPAGEDVSIGYDWRASMMAQSARDPYWQAGVRRELRDHPTAGAAIEHECSLCHMPMAHVQTRGEGKSGSVFANLGRGATGGRPAMAQDGVSCTVCHQIKPDNLGRAESFTGGFLVDTSPSSPRKAFGPFTVTPALARLMASASTFTPTTSTHVQSSELCATCHTLFTDALGPDGKVMARLAEQVPFLEWGASAFRDAASCADCHMPSVAEPTPIANLLAEPRAGLHRHEFWGGNFVVPEILKRLNVAMPALPQDFDHGIANTRHYLASQAATVSTGTLQVSNDRLETTITIASNTGHKLPTAFPSRRAWLHITVKDCNGAVAFESGAPKPDGRITGNDNDDDPTRFEPHHPTIERPDQVQIYESILGDRQGRVTTGLLHAVGYLKDNRILPEGFDKTKASADVAVKGEAAQDPDFVGGGDQVHLRVPIRPELAPFTVDVELLYQPIGYRWADNLGSVDAAEARTFTRTFAALGGNTYQRLATSK